MPPTGMPTFPGTASAIDLASGAYRQAGQWLSRALLKPSRDTPTAEHTPSRTSWEAFERFHWPIATRHGTRSGADAPPEPAQASIPGQSPAHLEPVRDEIQTATADARAAATTVDAAVEARVDAPLDAPLAAPLAAPVESTAEAAVQATVPATTAGGTVPPAAHDPAVR